MVQPDFRLLPRHGRRLLRRNASEQARPTVRSRTRLRVPRRLPARPWRPRSIPASPACAKDRVAIGLAQIVHRNMVGLQTGRDRSVHGVGHRSVCRRADRGRRKASMQSRQIAKMRSISAWARDQTRKPGKSPLRFIGKARAHRREARVHLAANRSAAGAATAIACGSSSASGRISCRYSPMARLFQITMSVVPQSRHQHRG